MVISPSRTATLIGLALALPVLLRQIAAWRKPGAAMQSTGAA
jgi:hypothetical protein